MIIGLDSVYVGSKAIKNSDSNMIISFILGYKKNSVPTCATGGFPFPEPALVGRI